ncbi:hypothetical protein [Anderseniella sp. Alg231-50]|uniref:hypothetical protein n=1 Tax=Anderseniella sp. Alg231-50 TaxID=1922226 RepID=UPI000D551356
MTGLNNFSEETIAVDSVSADLDVLEKLAAGGGTLSEDDFKLLVQCSARLSRLIPLLTANNAAAGNRKSPARKRPAKPKTARQSPTKFHL